MGLLTSSAPWLLSLAAPLRTLCSVQWLAKGIHLCICQALVGPLGRQLYQDPVSKHLLASTIVSGFRGCIRDRSRWSSLWIVIPSISAPHFVSVTPSIGILFFLLRRIKVLHTLVYLLLEFHVFYKLYLGYSKLWG